jgi:biopolymer transport protein ExbB/TolQ
MLAVLIAMSVASLGVGSERLMATRRCRRRLHRARSEILRQLGAGSITMAQAVNTTSPWHPATPLFGTLLATEVPAPAQIRRAQAQLLRRARRRLWVLGSIGSIAPFVGLLGTVLGVMEAFAAMGAQGAGGFQVVSAGLSEALVTTAAGIFVGIEAVLLFNYLQVALGAYAAELRESVEEIVEHKAEATDASAAA